MGSLDQRRTLGDFLRAQREKLTPGAVGLPGGTRRRTPGLRREEVAQISGLSATWYTWIEQGRDVSVSPTALARLANTLRLNRAERTYLFELAEKRDPRHDGGAIEDISPTAQACLDRIGAPAYILDRSWNARGWNAPAARLFAGWLDQPGERNLLRFIFLEPAARALISGWEERARRVVAEFRAESSANSDHSERRALIAALRRDSPEFATLWDEHAVLSREGGERTFNHPTDGFLRHDQITFNLVSPPDWKLTVLVERDSTGQAP
jgi:transcriptional regulator with XRE-family HTH domain